MRCISHGRRGAAQCQSNWEGYADSNILLILRIQPYCSTRSEHVPQLGEIELRGTSWI